MLPSVERNPTSGVETTGDVRDIPSGQRGCVRTSRGLFRRDLVANRFGDGCHGRNTQSLGDQYRSLLRRHPRTHVRGIGFEGFDEPQMMLRRGDFLVVIVGPVPPNGARGGT